MAGGQYGTAQGENVIAPYYDLFVQTDWKIVPSLVFNVGLRWEATTGSYYSDPDKQTVARYWLPEFYGNGMAEGVYHPKDGGDCGCNNDLNNFAPRLGVAWKWHDETVTLTDAVLHRGGAKGSDIGLVNTDDKDDIFSIIEVHRGRPEGPELRPPTKNPVSNSKPRPSKTENPKETERPKGSLLRNGKDTPTPSPL